MAVGAERVVTVLMKQAVAQALAVLSEAASEEWAEVARVPVAVTVLSATVTAFVLAPVSVCAPVHQLATPTCQVGLPHPRSFLLAALSLPNLAWAGDAAEGCVCHALPLRPLGCHFLVQFLVGQSRQHPALQLQLQWRYLQMGASARRSTHQV